MDKNTKKFALGAVVAGAVGYVAGILTAPKSGKETRKDIQTAASKAIAEAEKKLKAAQTELSDLIEKGKKQALKLKDKAKHELDAAIDNATEVKQKARELLSAARNGEADDKELQGAIDEVKKAMTHLNKYIKTNDQEKKT